MKYFFLMLGLIFVFVDSEETFLKMSSKIDSMIEQVLHEICIEKVILLTNESSISSNHDNMKVLLSEKFISRYPTENYNYQEIFLRRIKDLGEAEPLTFNRSSILFVTLSNTAQITKETELELAINLRASSLDSFYPKFILFFISEETGRQFGTLLKLAWLESLIDIIVYEVIVHNRADSVSKDYKKSKYFWTGQNNVQYSARIHRYNPFTNEYSQMSFESGTLLFPDKLINLHQYPVKIGIVHYPPYSFVDTEDPNNVRYTGVEGTLIRGIEETMNFKMIAKGTLLKDYGILFPNGSASGLLGNLKTGIIDVIAFGAHVFSSPYNRQVDRSVYIRFEQCCAIVPMIPDPKLITDTQFTSAIVMSIIMVTCIWLFSFTFRDKRRYLWDPLNITLLILGISVYQQPEKLPERFVYGCILVISLFYSSNIFAEITSFNVETDSVKPFDTFEELNASGLIPVIHPNMFNITFSYGGPVLESLSKRAIKSVAGVENCPTWLVSSANVSCIGEDGRAKFLISALKNSDGTPTMKVAQPCFWATTKAYILRKSSPYTNRFSKIIMHVIESGVDSIWWQDYMYEHSRRTNSIDEVQEDTDALVDMSYKWDLFFTGIFGYFASACAFIVEYIIHYYKKNFANKNIFLIRK